MANEKWLESPCRLCDKNGTRCHTCDRYEEWFIYAWDRMTATLRKKWGLPYEPPKTVNIYCKGCDHYEPSTIRPEIGWCDYWDSTVRETGFCNFGCRNPVGRTTE